MKIIAKNRKARHNFHVLETYEAGVVLMGTEVKACRAGNFSLAEAYAKATDGEMWLIAAHIAPYDHGNRNNHAPSRNRKLLMHKREIQRLTQQVEAKGLTLVPLCAYFSKGKVKVEVGLCRGKNVHDKRHDLKRRSDENETRRIVAATRK